MLQRILRVGVLAAILAALDLALVPGPDLGAQGGPNVFEKTQNLKVFAKDIPPHELREAMKSAAMGLGVRCWFCHVGEEGQDLSTFDFVSDEKPEKEAARVMFQMVMDINRNHMPKLAKLEGEGEEKEVRPVRCVTCHDGKPHPDSP